MIFKNKSEPRRDYTVIIGCGRVGASLAATISSDGGNTVIIDTDIDSFRKLPPSFAGQAVCGDGTEVDVLNEVGTEKASAVISVTDDDNINIMVAQLAKEMYSVPRVIARLHDPERECVYNEFGIVTICPALLSENEIDKMLGMNRDGKDGGEDDT